ncbi:MAG: type II toxin-antitoxin system death-on-curing family toxin [Clostridia bacterium]|nr:type II toxin-antitoxin system death-on-curing family toxin [Clostridia bacterium]
MKILTKDQVILLHAQLIEETGGSDGLRDEDLLDSAILAPFQSFDGKDLYPTVLEKGAQLGFGLIRNHAFVDGNKRIGAHAMLVFLALNGYTFFYTQKELSDIILAVASGDKSSRDLLLWLKSRQI